MSDSFFVGIKGKAKNNFQRNSKKRNLRNRNPHKATTKSSKNQRTANKFRNTINDQRKEEDEGIEKIRGHTYGAPSRGNNDELISESEDDYAISNTSSHKMMYEDIPTDDSSASSDSSDSDIESSDEESEEDEMYATASFEERAKLQKEASSMLALRDKHSNSNHFNKRRHTRSDKNAPTIQSSRRLVGRFREVVNVGEKKFKSRDPRFDPLCGQLDKNSYNNRYKFVNEIRSSEIDVLKKQLKTKKDTATGKLLDTDTQNTLQSTLTKLQQQQALIHRQEYSRQLKSKYMKVEKDKIAQGKKPYFPTKRKLRENELIDKFHTLEKSGKLNSYMQKKRKKNANKDHRWMPKSRR